MPIRGEDIIDDNGLFWNEYEVKELFAQLEELLDEDYDMSYTLGLPVRFRRIKSDFLGGK